MSELKTSNGNNLPTRVTPNKANSISTLNQLFAFKDVSCYVASANGTSKGPKMSRKQRIEESLEREASELIKVNSASQIHSASQQQSAVVDNQKQRTRSALPLLKNSLRFNKTSLPNSGTMTAVGNNPPSISFEQMRSNIVQHESQLTMNLNNCFNASSYKLINAPLMTTTGANVASEPSKPKKREPSNNGINSSGNNSNNTSNMFQKGSGRVRENSTVNKTSL